MAQTSKFWQPTTVGDGIFNPYTEPTDVAAVLSELSGCVSKTTNQGGVLLNELNSLAVSGTSSPVSVATGRAFVQGTFYENSTSPVSATVPTPVSATRIDRVVLRKDWTAQTVRIFRIQGAEGGAAPAMTQVVGSTWDIPLANLSITTGGVITVSDQREYVPVTNLASIPVIVQSGGTGATTFTTHGVLIGEGTSAVAATAAGTNNQVLIGQTGADPVWSSNGVLANIANTFALGQTFSGIVTANSQVLLHQGADIVSGSTLTLGTDGNMFKVTGTNAITTIAGVPQAGTLITLKFASAGATVANGNNIVTQGGLLYTSTASSYMQFVSDGTNMIETTRPGQLFGSKKLGSASTTSNQAITTTSTPGTDMTSLTVTCTPDGAHDVKVSFCLPNMATSGTGQNANVAILKDAAVVATFQSPSAPSGISILGAQNGFYIDAIPTNASHIYKLAAWASSATLNTVTSGTSPNVILVEQLG